MNLTELSKKHEHYVTPAWAARAILEKEILTNNVLDPCAGTFILGKTAKKHGYNVIFADLLEWQDPELFPNNILDFKCDFLTMEQSPFCGEFSVFMNPPFSKAVDFVEKSLSLGAKKVLCFQRLSFFSSKRRRDFFDNTPPTKIYLCAERATCFRFDLPENEKGRKYNPKTGRKYAETPTDHAWFVFEAGYTGSTAVHRIYKS